MKKILIFVFVILNTACVSEQIKEQYDRTQLDNKKQSVIDSYMTFQKLRSDVKETLIGKNKNNNIKNQSPIKLVFTKVSNISGISKSSTSIINFTQTENNVVLVEEETQIDNQPTYLRIDLKYQGVIRLRSKQMDQYGTDKTRFFEVIRFINHDWNLADETKKTHVIAPAMGIVDQEGKGSAALETKCTLLEKKDASYYHATLTGTALEYKCDQYFNGRAMAYDNYIYFPDYNIAYTKIMHIKDSTIEYQLNNVIQ